MNKDTGRRSSLAFHLVLNFESPRCGCFSGRVSGFLAGPFHMGLSLTMDTYKLIIAMTYSSMWLRYNQLEVRTALVQMYMWLYCEKRRQSSMVTSLCIGGNGVATLCSVAVFGLLVCQICTGIVSIVCPGMLQHRHAKTFYRDSPHHSAGGDRAANGKSILAFIIPLMHI